MGQGGAFVGKWREMRDKQGWLRVSRLPGSVLWPSPAPDGHGLSCLLLKLFVGLVGEVCAYWGLVPSLLAGCVWAASLRPTVPQIWLCTIYPAST